MKSKFIKLLLGSLLFVSAVYANAEKPTKEEVAKLYVATFNPNYAIGIYKIYLCL